jgi:hypothetical protein
VYFAIFFSIYGKYFKHYYIALFYVLLFRLIIILRLCCVQNPKDFKICTTIILLVVLYGLKTRSVTVRKKHRFKVFQNMMISGLKVERTGREGNLHHREPLALYNSPRIIRLFNSG